VNLGAELVNRRKGIRASNIGANEASSMNGLGAPRRRPTEIVERLNKAVNTALADPKIKARIADLGLTPLMSSPADLEKLIADETEKWGKVIRAANIKAN
jgi:tripartite-type tricarboxylate transporter receptor subunit TctC